MEQTHPCHGDHERGFVLQSWINLPVNTKLPMPVPPPSPSRSLISAIAEKNLPAFGLTLQELLKATDSDAVSGQKIAEVILRDPALTSRVLRAANAAHLGHGGRANVVTVSRAVVILGVNAIRSLCISALTAESLSTTGRHGLRVQEAFGRSLHAAVQARELARREQMGKDVAERLFIEALLTGIGEMAFWCFGEDTADQLERALQSGLVPTKAETTILGTTLMQLGRDLLQAWKLGGVLQDRPEVALARKLSQFSPQGWLISQTRQAIHDIAIMLKATDAETLEFLQTNAIEAAALATAMGAHQAVQVIPAEIDESMAALGAFGSMELEPFHMPDLQKQLRVLTEMSHVATTRKDFPVLLQTCLEGLHRAVGLDRCVFCLLAPERTRLQARMATGPMTDGLRQCFQWDWGPELESWLKPKLILWHDANVPGPDFLIRASETLDCFTGTFSIDQKAVGFFYADCKPSGRPLTSEGFDSFTSLVAQAELVMRALPR